MMARLLRILAAAGVLMLPLATRAQAPSAKGIPPLVADYMLIGALTTYDASTMPPKDVVAAAFGTEYGRALVANLAEALAASADKSCLQSKQLRSADFARGAAEIYDRYGTRMIEISRSVVNTPAYRAALAALAPSFQADAARLRGDPDVQKLLALEQPTRFSDVADRVAENLARYLLLHRISLKKPVWRLELGDTSLTDRYNSDDALEARYQFVANSQSPQLKQYIGLLKTMLEVRVANGDRTAALQYGPTQFFQGVETELAALCIPGIKQP